MRYLKASQMYAASTALNELFFRRKLTIIRLPTDKTGEKANRNRPRTAKKNKKSQDKADIDGLTP